MTKLTDYNIRAAGVIWVRKEDYPAFLAICEDAYGYLATWEEFIERSEKAENALKAQGYVVGRAYIDPEAFPDWCRSRGYWINSEAREAFAASVVYAKYGKNAS